MQGWIKDYRKELNSDIWSMPPLYHRVWQWIKYQANHEDTLIPMLDGSKMIIKKGQHLTSIRNIARGVGWYEGPVWKEPNPKTITTILQWLEKVKMVKVERGRGNRQYTLITVVNWDFYQGADQDGVTDNTTATGEARKQQTDINKNDKNVKNEKNYINNIRRKREKHVYDSNSTYMKMAIYFRDRILAWKPNAKIPDDLNAWADEFRKLQELDKRDKSEIKRVIDFATSDTFWQPNILSAKKLREKFDTLEAQSSSRTRPKKPKGGGVSENAESPLEDYLRPLRDAGL